MEGMPEDVGQPSAITGTSAQIKQGVLAATRQQTSTSFAPGHHAHQTPPGIEDEDDHDEEEIVPLTYAEEKTLDYITNVWFRDIGLRRDAHEFLAHLFHRRERLLTLLILILNTIAGSAVFSTLSSTDSSLQTAAGVLIAASAILSALNSELGYNALFELHERAHCQYATLGRKFQQLLYVERVPFLISREKLERRGQRRHTEGGGDAEGPETKKGDAADDCDVGGVGNYSDYFVISSEWDKLLELLESVEEASPVVATKYLVEGRRKEDTLIKLEDQSKIKHLKHQGTLLKQQASCYKQYATQLKDAHAAEIKLKGEQTPIDALSFKAFCKATSNPDLGKDVIGEVDRFRHNHDLVSRKQRMARRRARNVIVAAESAVTFFEGTGALASSPGKRASSKWHGLARSSSVGVTGQDARYDPSKERPLPPQRSTSTFQDISLKARPAVREPVRAESALNLTDVSSAADGDGAAAKTNDVAASNAQ